MQLKDIHVNNCYLRALQVVFEVEYECNKSFSTISYNISCLTEQLFTSQKGS